MATVHSIPGRTWSLFQPLSGAAFGPDLIAGVTLAAIAIPEQMATARMGGLPPQIGLIAFVAATLAFAAFGSNRLLSAGADSTITPIFAGALGALAASHSEHYAALAAALAMMVGAVLILAGVLKLGWIANLLSGPVMTGFMAGIAVHIVLSQLPTVLGVPSVEGSVFHRIAEIWRNAGAINLYAVGIALGVFAITYAAEKIDPRIPGALIAIAGATIAAIAFDLKSKGVAALGDLGGALPLPGPPRVGLDDLASLGELAGVIAIVVMVQTAATTRSFSAGGGETNVDRDYLGLGAAGVFAGIFGAFPVNASPPRTATVAETGGRSQLAGLLAALGVLALLLFGGQLLAQTPTAALAGVLLFVAQRVFKVGEFADLIQSTPVEFVLAVVTMALIVVLPIQQGVAIGIVLSLVHGVSTITRLRLTPFEQIEGGTVWWPVQARERAVSNALVSGLPVSLSFLNARQFAKDVMTELESAAGRTQLFVLEASGINEIDYTASGVFRELIVKSRSLGVDFAVARLSSLRAHSDLERFGILETLGADHLFHSVHEAVSTLSPAMPDA
jgi:MFS superfamily sulfate permease-like transporter